MRNGFIAGYSRPPVVQVFLKAPRQGFVKTRLAREVGNERALAIYRTLAEAQLAKLPPGWTTEIHYTPVDAGAEMRGWLGSHHEYRAQCDGDLGLRLAHAVERAFATGARNVFAIGADCPDLDASLLAEAQTALRQTDVVIGPARDGGYYLIGLKSPAVGLFEKIEWSTPRVLAQTLQRAQELGLVHALLPEKEDVDDLAGWQRHQGRLGIPLDQRPADA